MAAAGAASDGLFMYSIFKKLIEQHYEVSEKTGNFTLAVQQKE
jgi:hypothetical protein